MKAKTVYIQDSSVIFYPSLSVNKDAYLIEVHFPGQQLRYIGTVIPLSNSWVWTIEHTNFWPRYSTVNKKPICTSAEQAFEQMLAFVKKEGNNYEKDL